MLCKFPVSTEKGQIPKEQHSPRQKSIRMSTSHTSPLLTEFILESMYPTMFLWPDRSRCKTDKLKAQASHVEWATFLPGSSPLASFPSSSGQAQLWINHHKRLKPEVCHYLFSFQKHLRQTAEKQPQMAQAKPPGAAPPSHSGENKEGACGGDVDMLCLLFSLPSTLLLVNSISALHMLQNPIGLTNLNFGFRGTFSNSVDQSTSSQTNDLSMPHAGKSHFFGIPPSHIQLHQ